MSDTGYTLKIGDRSWVLADAEETAQAVPARVFRRAAKIAQSGESADFAQVEVMFSMLEAAAPSGCCGGFGGASYGSCGGGFP
jgi:hypothetical protein